MEKDYTYTEYVAEYIAERLSQHLGDVFRTPNELADAITEHDNDSGSFTYSNYEAKRLLVAWWYAVGDFIEEYKKEYGEEPQHNPFKSPELFHGLMVIIGAKKMLSKIMTSLKIAEPFVLTEELAEAIIRKNKVKKLFRYVNQQGKNIYESRTEAQGDVVDALVLCKLLKVVNYGEVKDGVEYIVKEYIFL